MLWTNIVHDTIKEHITTLVRGEALTWDNILVNRNGIEPISTIVVPDAINLMALALINLMTSIEARLISHPLKLIRGRWRALLIGFPIVMVQPRFRRREEAPHVQADPHNQLNNYEAD